MTVLTPATFAVAIVIILDEISNYLYHSNLNDIYFYEEFETQILKNLLLSVKGCSFRSLKWV